MLRFHSSLIRLLLRYLSYSLYICLFIVCIQYKFSETDAPTNSKRTAGDNKVPDAKHSSRPITNPKIDIPNRYSTLSQKCDNYSYLLTDSNPDDVRNVFYKVNTDRCVRNNDAIFPSFDFVFLVMVHNRAEYLQYLIDSITAQSNNS